MKNYYDELEVSKTASKEVIEKVYKVLAKKYHPDMHPENAKQAAEEKFKKISEAYEVLSNDEKRKKYDLELEASNPNISYDDYISVVKERDLLNNNLNKLKAEFYNFKNSVNNQQNYQPRSHINYNTNNTKANASYSSGSYSIPNSSSPNYNRSNKRTYYYTSTGRPASAFDYFKYRVKEILSNIFLIVLIILALILAINNFLPFNLFSLLFKI